MQNKANVYHQLCSLQISHILVCISTINFIKLYYHWYHHCIYKFVQLLFFSYIGTPIFKNVNAANLDGEFSHVTIAIKAIYLLSILHKDSYLCNILWKKYVGMLQIIDFKYSKIRQLPTVVNEIKQPLVKMLINKWKRVFSKSNKD